MRGSQRASVLLGSASKAADRASKETGWPSEAAKPESLRAGKGRKEITDFAPNKPEKKLVTDGRTDGRTDRRTDRRTSALTESLRRD